MSCARSQGPKNPCKPKTSTKTRPTTTGETEKGKSIRVTSSVRPRNEKRAMAHAAATPKTVFKMTAIGATSNVKPIARRVSGLTTRLVQYTPGPSASACAKTWTRGTITKTASSSRATVVSVHRSQRGSCWPRRKEELISIRFTPALQKVDEAQHKERKHEQDHGQR